MANIPGVVWVFVGVLIAGTSAYLGGLMPFLIAGVGCIVFGGYKMLTSYMTKPKENNVDKMHEGLGNQKYCSNCGAGAQAKANFCNRCGQRI